MRSPRRDLEQPDPILTKPPPAAAAPKRIGSASEAPSEAADRIVNPHALEAQGFARQYRAALTAEAVDLQVVFRPHIADARIVQGLHGIAPRGGDLWVLCGCIGTRRGGSSCLNS